MIPELSLKSIALPCKGMPDSGTLRKVSMNLTLDDLSCFSDKRDIALVNSNGKIVGWIPFEKLTDNLLQRVKMIAAEYQALLDSVDDAVTVVNSDGSIIGWNSGADHLYHYSEKHAERQPITRYFSKNSLVLMSILKNGRSVRKKYNQPSPNVHVLINCLPVKIKNKIVGAISVEHNINDIVGLNRGLSSSTAYIQRLESRLDNDHEDGPFHKIKGRSSALREAIKLSQKVATTDASLLITGESGVGKELFAQAIHQASRRSPHPFVAVNCGAIPSELFESELFGYESGAFTGALNKGKIGRLDAAKGGTLFLDEIGELPLKLQVKLLRVLQDKRYYRVGGTNPVSMDTRIIAATNRNLEKMVVKGRFRTDLYYRLNVVSISIPPLRERIEDIPELVQIYLNKFASKYNKLVPKLDPEVVVRFMQYSWPGNIRELRNTVQRLIILAENNRVTKEMLPKVFYNGPMVKDKPNTSTPAPLQQSKTTKPDSSDKNQIEHALQKTFGNKTAAARLLGISRVTLYHRIKKLF